MKGIGRTTPWVSCLGNKMTPAGGALTRFVGGKLRNNVKGGERITIGISVYEWEIREIC